MLLRQAAGGLPPRRELNGNIVYFLEQVSHVDRVYTGTMIEDMFFWGAEKANRQDSSMACSRNPAWYFDPEFRCQRTNGGVPGRLVGQFDLNAGRDQRPH